MPLYMIMQQALIVLKLVVVEFKILNLVFYVIVLLWAVEKHAK